MKNEIPVKKCSVCGLMKESKTGADVCQECASSKKMLTCCDQLRKEILAMVMRYGQESEITVYQTMGVLEMIKLDLIQTLERMDRDRE